MSNSTRSAEQTNPTVLSPLSSSRTHSPTSSWNGRQIALLAGCCVILGGGTVLSVLTMNPGPFLASVILVMSIGGATISSGATLPQSNSPKPTAARNPENFQCVFKKANNILKKKEICPDIQTQFTNFISQRITTNCDEPYHIAQAIIILNKANPDLVIAGNVSNLFDNAEHWAETLDVLYKRDPALITQETLYSLTQEMHSIDEKRGSFLKQIISGA